MIFLLGATAFATTFSDIPVGHPSFTAIENFAVSNYVSGYPDGTFRPDDQINRVEALKIILNTLDISVATYDPLAIQEFPDANETDWFYPFVQFAVQRGIVSGTDTGYLEPARTVNQAEFFKLLFNTHELYTSPRAGNQWYSPFLGLAVQTSLVVASGDPVSRLTRSEVVAVTYKFLANQDLILTQADLNLTEDAILDTLNAVQNSAGELAIEKSDLSIGAATRAHDRLPNEPATGIAYNLAQAVGQLVNALNNTSDNSTAIEKSREYLNLVKSSGDTETINTATLIEQELVKLSE